MGSFLGGERGSFSPYVFTLQSVHVRFTLDWSKDCTNPKLQRSKGSHEIETHAIKIIVTKILH
jgi:hypothetical protein